MKIDDNLFAIIIGGSLVKGNMMAESDIYYDIIVPDGTISKSIDKHFAPLYSSVLQEIGLTNYYVLKYSTTNLNRRNINTFVDEKDIAQFLNYGPLSQKDSKKKLFLDYRNKLMEEAKNIENKNKIQQSLSLITKKYFTISQKGKSWFGNSFHIAYDGNKSFSTRWTIMALESKLNEIIFQYILNSDDKDIEVPVSVKEQMEFIRKYNILEQDVLDKLEFYWNYLSACRYAKENNTWTDITPMEQQAIDEINKFVFSHPVADPMEEDKKTTINNSADLLSVIEDFVYDNSTNIGEFRRGYDKYSHLETWKNYTDSKNNDIFIKAQIIDLLVEIDSPEIREKLLQLNISKKYLDFIFESLDAIKLIDETFPKYSSIQGERSIQNYWDAVATTTKNPETMFALIAHKLTKAQNSQDKEDQLLLYSVYLPLSKRFGNPDIYEYVRNDSFECSHPVEYLNLLNIINTLYGIPYSKLKEYNGNLKQSLEQYFEINGLDMKNIEVKTRVKSLYSIYEKLNSSRRKENKEFTKLTKEDRNAIKFVINSDELFNRLAKEMKLKNTTPKSAKRQIINCIDKDFSELTPKEKDLLASMLAEMKNAIFTDYKLIDDINEKLAPMLKICTDSDDGLVNIDKLITLLENSGNKMAFELWFVKLFAGELKDLVGLHVVVEDKNFPDVLDTVGKRTQKDKAYSGLTDFFAENGIIFKNFDKNKKNKQARTKINASIKMVKGVPIPVEMCLYTRTDYEDETYGLYNRTKISAPHYIYKMGNDFDASVFEHIFSKELDYGFIDATDKEKKKMVFESDGIVPTEDLAANFEMIMKKLSGNITCFVEYEDGTYIQKMPEGSTVFDLATSKDFSDDINVAVYIDTGDQITSDFPLDNARTYKVIKRAGCFVSVPKDESEIHTTRAKLIYRRLNSQDKTPFSEFIESVGSVDDVTEVLNMLLENEKFKKILDDRNLDYLEISEKLFDENSTNKILKDKDLINDMVSLLFNVILDGDCENMLPSEFIKRSTQIATHYNLANMFELFEAIEKELIDFDEIAPFYNMCFVIKTKANVSTDYIISQISSHYTVKKLEEADSKYNLVVNDEKFIVEGLPLVDVDSIQQLIDLLDFEDKGLNIEHLVYQDDKRIDKDTDTVFVYTEFVQPKKEFPLMSLGNNVEQLVKHAMIHHSAIVRKILKTTKELAEKYDAVDKDEESIDSLLEEYPVLMTQILLGLYTSESYTLKTDDKIKPLAQESPYLLWEEFDLLKNTIQNPVLSTKEMEILKQYLPQIFRGDNLISANTSDVKVVVSRSLDLVESEDVYSFASLSVENGIATLYISEALLREMDNLLSADQKQNYLKNLAIHEIIEYIALSVNPDMDYTEVHNAFDKIDSQEQLTTFAKKIIPKVLRTKKALYEEVDSILNVAEPFEADPNKTIAFLLGNRMISSFTDTFNLYNDGIIGKIFISGNRRGTVDIISKIRKEDKYMKNINKTITRLEDVHTVEDLLSMTDDAFARLLGEDKAFISTGKSTETYMNRINQNRQVSEAYIIRWVILQDAKQAGKNEQEIAELDSNIILETEAFNTPQNITNLFEHEGFLEYIADRSDINIILIQTPFSQCRALATLNKYLIEHREKGPLKGKDFNIQNIDFGIKSEYYHYSNVFALTTSLGEWARLIAYSLKGDIIPHMKKIDGLQALPLNVLKDINALIPLLNAKDKATLVKLYTDAAKQDPNFETLAKLLKVLEQQVGRGNRYDLIASFLTYLYTDTTTRRQSEKDWEQMQSKYVLPDLVAEEEMSIEGRVENIHKILSAA